MITHNQVLHITNPMMKYKIITNMLEILEISKQIKTCFFLPYPMSLLVPFEWRGSSL